MQSSERNWLWNENERDQSMLVITSDDDDVEQSFKEYQTTFDITLNQSVEFVRGEGEQGASTDVEIVMLMYGLL